MSTSKMGLKSPHTSALAHQQANISPTGKPKKPQKPIRFIVLDTWGSQTAVVIHRTGRDEAGVYHPKKASLKRIKAHLNTLIPLGWEMDIRFEPGGLGVYFFAPSNWFISQEDKKCLVTIR